MKFHFANKEVMYEWEEFQGPKELAELGLTIVHPVYINPNKGSKEELRLAHQVTAWNSYSPWAKEHLKIVLADDGGPVAVHDVLNRPSLSKRLGGLDVAVYRIQKDLKYNTPGALNLGISQARTPWVMIMDSDCLLSAESLERLLHFRPTAQFKAIYLFHRSRVTNDPTLKEVTRPLGCTFLFEKAMFEQIHGFDEDFTGEWSGGYGHFDDHFLRKAVRAHYRRTIPMGIVVTEYMQDLVGRVERNHMDHHDINKRLWYAKENDQSLERKNILRFEFVRTR